MANCIELPFLGQTCLGDMAVRVGNFQLDLTHPGVLAMLVIVAALGIFVFRSPV